ncbi:MAG: FtsX-like permease family protein [bacterium]|nr:FtsX-like permease family protein [bacterium]
MIRHYLKIMSRFMLKNKILFTITLLSLAVGIVASMLIFLYVNYERSYDHFVENPGQVYRVIMSQYKEKQLTMQISQSPAPMGPSLKEKFPEVTDFARITDWENSVISFNEKAINVKEAYRADASLLRMLSIPLVKGDPNTALDSPLTAVVSESCARKLFGDQEPINKTIVFKSRTGDLRYTVKGVSKDRPKNSHLQFDILFSIFASTNKTRVKDNWRLFSFNSYIRVHPKTDIKNLEEKISKFVVIEKRKGKEEEMSFTLQPLGDIHLHSEGFQWEAKRGNYKTIYFLSIIGLFILLNSWFNYIIVATADSMRRAHEIGLRKVVGATRLVLVRQFLLEALLLNIFALVMALILLEITLPTFNQLFGINLSLAMLKNAGIGLPVLALFLLYTFLSGLYPAFVLSSYKPVSIMSGKLKSSVGGKLFRKALVVLQITSSIFLIIISLSVYKQVNYMISQDLKIDLDQVLLISNPTFLRLNDNVTRNGKLFVEELVQYPEIKNITSSNFPGDPYFSTMDLKKSGSTVWHEIKFGIVDYNFLDTYDLELLAGRNFSKEFSTDNKAILINEKAVELYGFQSPEKALDQILTMVGGDGRTYKIIGVVKNYHQQSLKEVIDPVGFRMNRYSAHNYLSIKLHTTDTKRALELVKAKFNEHFPGFPFEYSFADEYFDRQYQTDRKFKNMLVFLTMLAIFIACIGLWALAVFTVATRKKEIAIRKSMGASLDRILTLLSKDYVKLIAFASFIALPIGFFTAKNWLANYAYRIELGWWFFIFPVLIILLTTLITVSYHVIKIARSNPVNSLRYE